LTRSTEEEPACGHASNLRIDVIGVGLAVTDVLRAQVDRSVLLALSRFGGQIRVVSVRVARVVNPLGGFDQQCRMRASLRRGGGVRAEVINGRITAAVDRAAVRLAVRVACFLEDGVGEIPPRVPRHRVASRP
jgi:hypothetical protein